MRGDNFNVTEMVRDGGRCFSFERAKVETSETAIAAGSAKITTPEGDAFFTESFRESGESGLREISGEAFPGNSRRRIN